MAFLALLIYCILIVIRPGDWVPMVMDWPLEFAVLGLTLAMAIARQFTDAEASERWELQPYTYFLLGWVVVVFFSNLYHGELGPAVEFAIVYGKRALIFVAFWFVLDSTPKIRTTMFLFIILAALLGLQGMYQKENGVGWAGQPLYWDNRIRWVGLWDGANVLSLIFVFTVPFVLEVIFGKWNFFAKILAAACGVLIVNGLILAASRGAWLSLGVIVIIFFARKAGKKGMIIGTILLVALMAVGPSRLTRDDGRDEKSAQHRVDMWALGLDMLKDYPVLGVGKGQFLRYSGMLIAHNSYVQNMGEVGLVGLFVWLGLIYLAFKSLRAVLKHSDQVEPNTVAIARATSVSLTGYLTASMFITTDFDLLYIILGLCAAVLVAARRDSGDPIPLDFDVSDVRRIAVIVVGAVTAMYITTRSLS